MGGLRLQRHSGGIGGEEEESVPCSLFGCGAREVAGDESLRGRRREKRTTKRERKRMDEGI